jgi:hypothetical protein
MRILIGICAVLALCACTRIGATKPSNPAAVRGCDASATAPWRTASGQAFQVEATSSGPDCAHAVATLAIRDPQGAVVWADAGASEHIMPLAPAHDLAAMQRGLNEWINPNSRTITTSAGLPAWVEGAEQPKMGEFPFYPERDFDRTAYEALRTRGVPVICYVQGMESLACIADDNGEFTKVGVQTFPG